MTHHRVRRFQAGSNHELLKQEAQALLARLQLIRPFALQENMVPAAAIKPLTLRTIDRFLIRGRHRLFTSINHYLDWLQSQRGQESSPDVANRRYAALRLHFNQVVSELDIFSDVITQRGETDTGVMLSGLDLLAADALQINGQLLEQPGMICYLDRGHGAAIRRALTYLPTGGLSPVAVIKIPRERMVGSGVASSLIHEVGHQGISLFGLADSVRSELESLPSKVNDPVWSYWSRCLNEILADLWAVAKVGLTASVGLIGVVTLPRQLVFHLNPEGPHPMPWLRVRLSIAFGRALFADPQWDRIENEWLSFYPVDDLSDQLRELLDRFSQSIPALIRLVINHRPSSLGGVSLGRALMRAEMMPSNLTTRFQEWQRNSSLMLRASPCEVFAVIGQARYHGMISPQNESQTLSRMLKHWAVSEILGSYLPGGRLPAEIASATASPALYAVRRNIV
ncbi:MAG: hypothetical protein ACOYLF_12140 [Blastocatellia bacterium]